MIYNMILLTSLHLLLLLLRALMWIHLRLYLLLSGWLADALIDLLVMDESDQLEKVNLAEDVLEDEPKVGLGLNWTD